MFLKRILAVSLAAAMLTGTAAFTEIGTYITTNISVSAAEITPASSFEYEENGEGGINGLE